jgi:hypothetical protein
MAQAAAVLAPRRDNSVYSWDLEKIRQARDQQMNGNFRLPAKLAEHLRTDDTLYTAYHNRIAPQNAVQAKLVPADGTRGEAVARKARAGIVVSRTTLAGINGTLANHGVAIGYNDWQPNEDGTCIAFKHVEWPLSAVRHNPSTEVLETSTREGLGVPIVHGDGRWTIYSKFDIDPWKQEAAVLPGALIWAAHSMPLRDWAGSSKAHGRSRVVGTMPEGMPLQEGDEATLSPEAQMFLEMLIAMVNGESGAGLLPFGAKAEFISDNSTAYQVFQELVDNREKAAQRVYLGTDATLGAAGGAPGVDISALFGVATTKVQGDLSAITRGLDVGVYQPWTAINVGDSRLAPSLRYMLPDPDAQRTREELHSNREYFFATLDGYKRNGFVIDQATVTAIAAEYDVPPPTLAGAPPTSIPLAPTDIAKAVRAAEVRSSVSLPPFGDERDNMTLPELDAYVAARMAQLYPAPGSEPVQQNKRPAESIEAGELALMAYRIAQLKAGHG